MKTITVYYKFNLSADNRVYLKLSEYAALYDNEECTNVIGYYGVSKKVNPYSIKNFLAQVNIVLLFNDNVVEYNYVAVDNSEIVTPITYYNKWNGEGNIGKINRVVLPDNQTRKVTITINE